MSGGNCMPTHSPHLKMQKALKTLQVPQYPTKTTLLQPESSEVIHHTPHRKARYQAKSGIHFSNLQAATLRSCPLPGEPCHHPWRHHYSLPKMPPVPPPGWWRWDLTNLSPMSSHSVAPSWAGDALTLQGSLLSTSNQTAVGSVEKVVTESVLSPNSKNRWQKLDKLLNISNSSSLLLLCPKQNALYWTLKHWVTIQQKQFHQIHELSSSSRTKITIHRQTSSTNWQWTGK